MALAWYVLLCSGYDLGQLFHGAMVLISKTPDGGDAGRTAAYSGVSLLTMLPVRLGGVVGVVGCTGLIASRRWAFAALLLAACVLIWPVMVWIVSLTFWLALDPVGSIPLFIHIVITVMVGLGLPGLAIRNRRSRS